jgi:hypothetical protein
MLLSSCHSTLLPYQFVSLSLVHKRPGIPHLNAMSVVFVVLRRRAEDDRVQDVA